MACLFIVQHLQQIPLGPSCCHMTHYVAHAFWHRKMLRCVSHIGQHSVMCRSWYVFIMCMQHKGKCGTHSFVANGSANVLSSMIPLLFWLLHHGKIILFYYCRKTLLMQLRVRSLWRKMTIIGNWHIGIWAQHAQMACRACRDIMGKVEFGLILVPNYTTW